MNAAASGALALGQWMALARVVIAVLGATLGGFSLAAAGATLALREKE
jgi:hypothetical protein